MDIEELLRRVCPTIARTGAAWYFAPATLAVGKELGLSGSRFYFLGRGGVLGDVEWPVVLSAFGYFKPSLIEHLWNSSKERVAPRDAARAYLGCCADFGRSHLAGLDGLGAYCEAGEAVIAQGLADPAGLTLFAATAAEPLPDDVPGRAMQVTAVLRELRGSAHLTAVVAQGLPTPVAHRISRPDELGAFGWEEGELPEPTAAQRGALDAAEALTDRLVARCFAAGGEAGAAALVQGVQAIASALDTAAPAS